MCLLALPLFFGITGDHLGIVDIMCQRKTAALFAIRTLRSQQLAGFHFALVFQFGSDRHDTALDVYLDVLLFHARNLRLHGVRHIRFRHIELDARLHIPVAQGGPKLKIAEPVLDAVQGFEARDVRKWIESSQMISHDNVPPWLPAPG